MVRMDYIYYRMYVWYKRKNDCAIVNSILFITSVKFFLCFPIMGIVIAFFESDKNNMTLMLYLVYAILMLMHSEQSILGKPILYYLNSATLL